MKVLSEIYDSTEECSKPATVWDQAKKNVVIKTLIMF